MIVIHIGILIYPVEDTTEKGPVLSKYRVLEYFWDPK